MYLHWAAMEGGGRGAAAARHLGGRILSIDIKQHQEFQWNPTNSNKPPVTAAPGLLAPLQHRFIPKHRDIPKHHPHPHPPLASPAANLPQQPGLERENMEN